MTIGKTRPALIFTARVGAPPEAVFDVFFGQPTRWLCRQASIDQQVGGRVRMCFPDGCFEGRFAQFDPPGGARFSWRMDGDVLPETMIVMSIAPAEADERSVVTVEHYGFGVGPDWDMQYVGAARAWAGYLKNLRAVLETGVDLREDDE